MGLFRAFLAVTVLVALFVSSPTAAPEFSVVPGGEPWPRDQHGLRGRRRRRVQGRAEPLLPLRAARWLRLHRHLGVATREARGSVGPAGQPRNRDQLAQPRGRGGPVARRALDVLRQRPAGRRGRPGHLGVLPRARARPVRLAGAGEPRRRRQLAVQRLGTHLPRTAPARRSSSSTAPAQAWERPTST